MQWTGKDSGGSVVSCRSGVSGMAGGIAGCPARGLAGGPAGDGDLLMSVESMSLVHVPLQDVLAAEVRLVAARATSSERNVGTSFEF